MYKACAVCGKIHDSRKRCTFKYNYTDKEERELRSTYKWTKKSLEIRQDAQYLCEVCRDSGVITYEGVEVHHIEKVKDRQDMLLDNYNLICLCQEHHKQADRGEISKDYLRSLAEEREKKHIPHAF